MKLLINALIKFTAGLILVGLLLFLPAFTFNYLGAWLFIGLLFIPMFIMGVVMLIKAPKLLEKRLNNKEKEKTQKGVIAFSGLIFPIGFILSALDFRFAWSEVPTWLVICASALFWIGYIMYAEVMREKILRLTNDEIPHGTAVVIEAFEEKKDLISIRAEIFCERESHKGILIGKHGATLKKIGTYAREDLEAFLGVKVYLNLWIKVKENWRDSAAQVANFGFIDE